jgi:hypothetical protein
MVDTMACPITLYTILKDFSLPLVALTWAVYSWYRDNKRVLSIRQVGDAYSERVADTPTGITTFSIEVVVTNDSSRTNIVIACYDLELPRKDDDFDPVFDPRDLDPPSEFYKIHPESIQVERDKVLNHRRYQNGKLGPVRPFGAISWQKVEVRFQRIFERRNVSRSGLPSGIRRARNTVRARCTCISID